MKDILDCASLRRERRYVSFRHVLLNNNELSCTKKYRRDCERSFLLLTYVTFVEGNSYLSVLFYIEFFKIIIYLFAMYVKKNLN